MGAIGGGRGALALGNGKSNGEWWCLEREEGWLSDWGHCCHRVLPDSAGRQQAATWSTMGAVLRSSPGPGPGPSPSPGPSNNGDGVVTELWWWRMRARSECRTVRSEVGGGLGGELQQGGWLTVTVTGDGAGDARRDGTQTGRLLWWTDGRGGCDAQRGKPIGAGRWVGDPCLAVATQNLRQ